MWEPFSEPARRAIVRAQEVAQVFGSTYIGTEHIAFALAEGDDDVGHLFANALDRDAMRERLGAVTRAPVQEMVFSPDAKRAIESAFEHARRLGHNSITPAHIALGVLSSGDPPPLLPGGNVARLHERLDVVAAHEEGSFAIWKQVEGPDEPHAAAHAILTALRYQRDLARPGTRVTITVAPPGGEQRTWAWEHVEQNEE
jgi:hypothetical protein